MTSIKWLKEEFKTSGVLTDEDFEQAERIHEQEIKDSYEAGVDSIIDGTPIDCDTYYEQKFKTD